MALSFTKIKETCLYISDINQTKDFYHDKLGLPIISEAEGNHIFFRAGESMLLCFLPAATKNQSTPPPHHGSGQLHFALECDKSDYESWRKKVKGERIIIEYEADWNGLKSFYFRDPDQHSVEIVMKGIWGNASED